VSYRVEPLDEWDRRIDVHTIKAVMVATLGDQLGEPS
jgi:hypothetical protein